MTPHTYEQQQRAGYEAYLNSPHALAHLAGDTPSFWFPKLQQYGAIISGNAGLWLTQSGISTRLSAAGTGPIWAGFAPVWNDTATNSTRFNGYGAYQAFHEYSGSEDFRWAGFDASGIGRTDIFHNGNQSASILGACVYRFGGERTAYLTPFQSEHRSLIVDGATIATGALVTLALSRDGAVLVYSVATGSYSRQILSKDGKVVSIRDNEAPIVAFLGPGGQPWLMTGTPDAGTLVYPAFSAFGYQITGDLFYPDARMTEREVSNAEEPIVFADQLRVVGSLNNGALREVWIDFAAPRVDLRLV